MREGALCVTKLNGVSVRIGKEERGVASFKGPGGRDKKTGPMKSHLPQKLTIFEAGHLVL